MKFGLLVLVVAALLTDPALIAKINRTKDEAKKAYAAGDYETAVAKYKYLTDSLQVTEDEVLLNLANAYFQLSDTTNAIGHYQTVSTSAKNSIRSTAHQQLGVVKNKQGKFEEALNNFKNAIKADPSNEDARYNYEMLRRKLDEQKKQEEQNKDNKQDKQKDQQDQQNKDQEKKDQEKKDQEKKENEQKDNDQKKDSEKQDQEKKEQEQQQKDKENEDKDKKENQPSSQKLEQMKITEEKAKMILEAMKNQEIQYLQQNKRKATQPKDKSKPDW